MMPPRRVVRIALATAVVVALAGCEEMRENTHPVCEVRPPTILMAESVRTASRIPCVRSLPVGWGWGAFRAEDGETTFVLDSIAGGDGSVSVRLVGDCRAERTDGEPVGGVVMDERVVSHEPFEVERTYSFDGGCAIVRVAFVPGAPVERLLRDLDRSIGFLDRAAIDRQLRSQSERRLDPAGV